MIHYFCPVCWEPVMPTPKEFIYGHFDTASHYCLGSYEPFHITVRTIIKTKKRVRKPKNSGGKPEKSDMNGDKPEHGENKALENGEICRPEPASGLIKLEKLDILQDSLEMQSSARRYSRSP